MSGEESETLAHGAESSSGDEIPLCTRCLSPHSPLDYYCHNCGAAVGQFTANLPFIDIPFYANFYARLWHRVWFEPSVAFIGRALALLLILVLAPIMLVGLPFVWIARRKKRLAETA